MREPNSVETFHIGDKNKVTFGDGRLTLIAGPCGIESYEHAAVRGMIEVEGENINEKIQRTFF